MMDLDNATDRFSKNLRVEICFVCAGQGLHGKPDYYIANSYYKPTAEWMKRMKASRFLGPDRQLREDIDEYLSMAARELESALAGSGNVEAKRKLYHKMLGLQAKSRNFKRLTDWVTRLTSTELPFGVHLLYGHGHKASVNLACGATEPIQLL